MKYAMALVCLMIALVGCKVPLAHNLPPAEQIMHPGPGVDGPGPGVMIPSAGSVMPWPGATSQVAFVGPEGMMVAWDVSAPGAFDSDPLVVPGRYNFPQGAIYRLKLTNIPGRAGVELYPTLEIAPTLPRTDAYLAHNAIPYQLTDEDFDQVLSGNFVTKVIYLPDAEFQELALAGVETLVSTKLDPGVDPIVEADRRGSILAIIRIGNKDLQVPGLEGDGAGGYGPMYGGGGGPGGGGPCPLGCGGGSGRTDGPGSNVPPMLMAGVTAPQYGMPISGTPIGLPGPPHIPLGVPAGLQKHVMRNHTHMHIPGPVAKVKIDVKQKPGLSYPKPASHVCITESVLAPPALYSPPTHHQVVGPGASPYVPTAPCGDESCPPQQ
ncbi:MAG: hypothetical protein HYX69_13555 [Planctomycetia bacterium]|nr:hypothetical protein [Planctomycetia bacterium]